MIIYDYFIVLITIYGQNAHEMRNHVESGLSYPLKL